MMPIGPLMIEHRLIERMIAILEKHVQSVETAAQIDLVLMSQGIDFLLRYADHCHHGKEKDLLFKAISQKNIAVKHQRILDELMEEHAIIQETVKSLTMAVDNASQGNVSGWSEIIKLTKKIAALYPPHIEKEDQCFFLPVMSYFTQDEKDLMLRDIACFDKNLIHEHYRRLVENLEKTPVRSNSQAAPDSNMDSYECTVCGYQYNPALGDPENGIKPGTPFSELPENWVCPICRASKAMFQRLESNTPARSNEPGKDVAKEYRSRDIIVHWYPQLCSHAGKCWGELPQVFNKDKRPWINLSASTPEELLRTIDLCPSRALRYSLPEGSSVDPALARGPGWLDYKIAPDKAVKIRMIRNGPLLLEGPARVFDADKQLIKESDRLVLCRCGKTNNPPFCDGSHMHNN